MTPSYYFTEEHHLFRQSMRDFLQKEVIPHIPAWEEAGEVPREIFEQFGEMGFLGLDKPEAYGGSQLDIWFTVIFYEELARVNSGGFGAAVGAHAYLALTHMEAEGNPTQKERYLRPGITGKKIGCLAITEPGGGSDVQAMTTSARLEGDHYVLNGSKTFITNGVNSDFLIVAGKTQPGEAGISLFIVDRDAPGLTATKLKKLGWHASDTGEIAFDGVKIPKENLLGEENKGFLYIMQHFVSERLAMAIGGIATAAYGLEVTLRYMQEREAFG
ncbi:MAG: acyl-CoA dehydrogenase family protein, partial [Bacteroidota bacterium]